MIRYLLITSVVFSMAVSTYTQEYIHRPGNPFQIQLVSTEDSLVAFKYLFADRDRDGDLDLFEFGFQFDTSGISSIYHMIHYIDYQENIGTKEEAMFGPREKAFENFTFPNGMFTPAIGDLNGDGYLDIVASAQIDTSSEEQHIVIYQNTGETPEVFDFILAEAYDLPPFWPRSMSTPEVADFDMDGDPDILVSAFIPVEIRSDIYTDLVLYAKNTGTQTAPDFLGWFDSPYGLGQDSTYEMMKAGDMDHDGDMDILSLSVGSDSLTFLTFYGNTPGMNGKPAYEPKILSPFGLPEAKDSMYFIDLNLVDIDSDQDLDVFLLTLTADGSLTLDYYENIACVTQNTSFTDQICDGESVTIGGMTFTESGEYAITLTSGDGCDSIVHLTLEVIPVYEVFLTETICQGESYTIDGQEFTSTGDYMVPLLSAEGCDSVILLHLDVLPVYEVFLSAEICEGEIYQIGGQDFTITGEYSIPLLTVEGCDSIIQLELQVLPVYEEFRSEVLCEGDVYIIGEQEFTNSGTYQVVLMSTDGCDSIINAELLFQSVDISVTIQGQQLAANQGGAFYQWIDCNTGQDIPGATSQIFAPEVSGSYAVLITDQIGCEGTSGCNTVVITGVHNTELAAAVRIYPNPATTQLRIENASALELTGYRIYALSGQLLQTATIPESQIISLRDMTTGIYLLEIQLGEHAVLHKFAVIQP